MENGLPDLRRIQGRRSHFPEASEAYHNVHRNIAPHAYHEILMTMPNLFQASATGPGGAALFGVEIDGGGSGGGGGGGWSFGNSMDGGGNSRWPRQETLTLLEIRSRLDSKFKEANHKSPLWDEVSRIMAEEHGYQRSGKKCREKFENLYKYYKKTKEGKAGRQDGKNYRFFRQLEALYCNQTQDTAIQTRDSTNLAQRTTTPNNAIMSQEQRLSHESLSFSNNASDDQFETSSSTENNDNNNIDDLSAIAFMMKQKSGSSSGVVKKRWEKEVKEFVESQMKKLTDSQDVWMERILKTIEDKENERNFKEEEWRRIEAARFDKEHQFWAKERARVEARDAALMEALEKLRSSEKNNQDDENMQMMQFNMTGMGHWK